MNNLLAYFSRQPRMKLLVIGYLLVLAIFGLDYATGVEFTFSIFYLIAVFFDGDGNDTLSSATSSQQH